MTPSNKQEKYRPFSDLKRLLAEKRISIAQSPETVPKDTKAPFAPQKNERQLFEEEMADVKPLKKRDCQTRWSASNRTSNMKVDTNSDSDLDEDGEILLKLKEIVENGNGFVISQTPEYIQGAAAHVSPDIIQRLHHGSFSIQDHIDLHGLNVIQAQTVFDQFLSEAIRTGKRAVLIVHGRGLSSADIPVLKNMVYQWLTRGRWKKWVVAFSSARACDGGAGATYLLLRHNPLNKKQRKADGVPKGRAFGKNHMIPPS